jgi:cephalosporin-C deacetylase-like acetyl esterase
MSLYNDRSIGIWGTSFAGGHALVAASQLDAGTVKAIVSQVPHLDGKNASKRALLTRGVVKTLKTAVVSLTDIVRWGLGLLPLYVKIAGTTTDLSFMTMTQDELTNYFNKHPKVYLGGWRNLAPARSMALMSQYSPMQSVSKISVPILFIAAAKDELCPLVEIQQAYALTANPDSQLMALQCNHFQIYLGENGEIVKSAAVDHFRKSFGIEAGLENEVESVEVESVEVKSVEVESVEEVGVDSGVDSGAGAEAEPDGRTGTETETETESSEEL